MSLNRLKKALEKKEPIQFSDEEIRYSLKPVGKSHLKKNELSSSNDDLDSYSLTNESSDITESSESSSYIEEIPNKNLKYKRIICEICGKEYCTNNSGKHRATKHHQLYSKMNKKLLKILSN